MCLNGEFVTDNTSMVTGVVISRYVTVDRCVAVTAENTLVVLFSERSPPWSYPYIDPFVTTLNPFL